jgi:hypothetical protein
MFYPRRKQPRACAFQRGRGSAGQTMHLARLFRLLVSFSSKKGVSTDTDSNTEVPRIGFFCVGETVKSET